MRPRQARPLPLDARRPVRPPPAARSVPGVSALGPPPPSLRSPSAFPARAPDPDSARPDPALRPGSPARPPGTGSAATCGGRRASQRPAAAILHFQAAALFRESTLTCEPYPRNRSAGSHGASELGRPRGARGARGLGRKAARRGARPGGRLWGRGGRRGRAGRGGARPHARPRRPGPAPPPALGSWTRGTPGVPPAATPKTGCGSRPAPLSTGAPPPPAEAPPRRQKPRLPRSRSGPAPWRRSPRPLPRKPGLRSGPSGRQPRLLSASATPPERQAFLLSAPDREKYSRRAPFRRPVRPSPAPVGGSPALCQ